MMFRRLMSLVAGASLGGVASLAHGAYDLELSSPVMSVPGFHALFVYVILAILLAVFAAMFYSIYAHRKSCGRQATHFHPSTAVEVVWSVIPFVILMGAAYPATKTIIDHESIGSHQFSERAVNEQRVASR